MSLVNPGPITTPLGYAGPVSNVQPFTYRDGATYALILEAMRYYINNTLVASVNDAINGLDGTVDEKIAALDALVTEAINAVEEDKTAAQAAQAAAEAARDLAQQYAEASGDAADAAMLTVWQNVVSAFRIALDAEYANVAEFTSLANVLNTGRLAEATLGPRFDAKASNARIDDLETEIDSEFASAYSSINGKANAADVIKEGAVDAKFAKLSATESRYDVTRLFGPVGARLTIPTHLSPAGGQTVHPSLVYFPDSWNGYRYWLAHTPFPGANDDHEDPNLAVSQDGITWIAAPGVTQPLDDADGTPEYNSDPSLVLGPDNTLYLFWRFYDSGASVKQEKVYYRKSTDGVSWTPKTLAWESDESAFRYLSPSFLWDNNRWTMWSVNRNATPNTIIRRQWDFGIKDPFPLGASGETVCTIGVMQANKEPWHLEVKRVGQTLIALINDTTLNTDSQNGDLLFASSIDGVTWTNNANIAIPRAQAGEHDNLYKATFIPGIKNGVNGFRVIYSAFMAAGSVWNLYDTFVEYDGEQVGTFAFNTFYNNHTQYAGITLTKRGNKVRARGVATLNQTVAFAANFPYVLGTIPVGWRPAANQQMFRPASVSPNNPAWSTALTNGNIEFNLINAQSGAAVAWIIGIDLEWSTI